MGLKKNNPGCNCCSTTVKEGTTCICGTLPPTLHVTVDNIVPGLYQDHTLESMTLPTGYAGFAVSAVVDFDTASKYWYSPIEYSDGTADAVHLFRYVLECFPISPGVNYYAIGRDFKNTTSGKENPIATFATGGAGGRGFLVSCSPFEATHTVVSSVYATAPPGQVAKSNSQITGAFEPLDPPVTVTVTG